MSKQPRGNVRVGMGNTAGERVSNIFTDVKKFQIRFNEAMEKATKEQSKVILRYSNGNSSVIDGTFFNGLLRSSSCMIGFTGSNL